MVDTVDAKKLTVGTQNVLAQARYAKGLVQVARENSDARRCPFFYSTNGEFIWFHDVEHPLSRCRRIADLHTASALGKSPTRDFDPECAKLLSLLHDHPRLRPHEKDASTAVEKSVSESKWDVLVAMATGTGKTFTVVNQIYWLMRSGAARPVVFFVDSRPLADRRKLSDAPSPRPGRLGGAGERRGDAAV